PRDPVKVVDEIQHYVEKYGAGNFPFQDLTAVIQKDWIVAFCEELLRRDLKITWQLPSGTRSEAIDAEVAGLLKPSNMIMMAYAPESLSETTRRLIKKKMKTERLEKSIKAAADAGLCLGMFFVIGFPHDTKEHFQESMEQLERYAAMGVQDVSFGYYMALPGTELFNSLYDAGKLHLDRTYFHQINHSVELWPAASFCELSRWELGMLKMRLLKRFYSSKQEATERAPFLASL